MKISSRLLVSLLCLILITLTVSAQNVSPIKGSDSVKCVTNLSLFNAYYKDKNYPDALTAWRYVVNNCPQASENSFINGANMFRSFIETENDAVKRTKQIDTLMWIYDLRIKYFGNEGKILSEKALDLYAFDTARFFEAYTLFKQSVSLTGNATAQRVISTYCNVAAKSQKAGKIQQVDFLKIYEQSGAIVEENLLHAINKDDSLKWFATRHNIDDYAEPLLDCQSLMKNYKNRFETAPNDVELLHKISNLLVQKNCLDDSLIVAVSEKLYKTQPNPTLAFFIAKAKLKIKNYVKASEYLHLVLSTSENSDEKAQSNYFLGLIEVEKKIFSEARNFALKALEAKPSFGDAYILIANCYAQDAAKCGEDEVTSRAAYWCAVDKLNKAKMVDPTVESTVNNLLTQYTQCFPNKETLFFHDLKEGTSYTVGCWINEKTTVRASR